MRKILIATHNTGKLREFSSMFARTPFELVSLSDVGIDVDVEETGATYAENATLKAVTYARLSGLPTLADDSGLEVDGLDGEPGPRSARYAGEDANDDDRIAFLLQKLNNIPREKWTARFRCVIALTRPDRPVELFEGSVRGRHNRQAEGRVGFRLRSRLLHPGDGQDDGGVVIRREEPCEPPRSCKRVGDRGPSQSRLAGVTPGALAP